MASILRLHPDATCQGVASIAAEAGRPAPGRLALTFRIAGAGLLVPPPAEPRRADELWKHTCFEAFLRAPGEDAYLELNLSPSGQWAAYAFDDYRAGMRNADVPAPRIAWREHADGFALEADLDLSATGLPAAGPWRIGLTAVIEETSGRSSPPISHWALAHPPGRADFHHDEGFALTLPGPTPA